MDTLPLVVRIVGVVLALMGVIFVIHPLLVRKLWAFFIVGKRIYLAALIRVILGVLFLLAASACRLPIVIIVIGILMLAAAVLIVSLKKETIDAMINYWLSKPLIVVRLISLVLIAFGALIVYSV